MDYGFMIRSILIQLIIFCIIPFTCWLIRERKKCRFFEYIGVYAPKKTTLGICLILLSMVVRYGAELEQRTKR